MLDATETFWYSKNTEVQYQALVLIEEIKLNNIYLLFN